MARDAEERGEVARAVAGADLEDVHEVGRRARAVDTAREDGSAAGSAAGEQTAAGRRELLVDVVALVGGVEDDDGAEGGRGLRVLVLAAARDEHLVVANGGRGELVPLVRVGVQRARGALSPTETSFKIFP